MDGRSRDLIRYYRRDWRTEQWDTGDWARARELADEYWSAIREGLYVYEATRALRNVAYEHERARLEEEERVEWEWYCAIYPDLKEA